MSLEILASTLDRSGCSKGLLELGDFNRPEKLALCLENEQVGLLLDIEDVVFKQEVLTCLSGHGFDQTKSLIKIVVFVKSLQEV